ncbi:MAG TPA: HepT-like ribonuclease domain-containing protein [Candidatus Thermoplasmatota archaeon]|nr:HepT-like ribonuclease domain-containing protein [Candidatus Thermoplasmatota archaeon]
MKAEDRARARFGHVLQSVERIFEYARHGSARFLSDPMVQDAVMRRFEIVGEAIKQISSTFRNAHPEVRWADLARFRDFLVHGYDAVSANRVWEIVEGPLRDVGRDLQRLRKRLGWWRYRSSSSRAITSRWISLVPS